MACLTSAKLTMLADILKPEGAPSTVGGEWTVVQNPESGHIERVWVDDSNSSTPPNTIVGVPCIAKVSFNDSIKAAEEFGADYLNEEWVTMTVSSRTDISLRDKVTRIRTRKGVAIWTEEESSGNPATVFDVVRISPVVEPFGSVIEKKVLLKRAEVQ